MARLLWIRRFSLGLIAIPLVIGFFGASDRGHSALAQDVEASEEASDEVGEKADTETETDRGPASLPSDYRSDAQTLPHRISRVTIYSDRAEITRSAKVSVGGGNHWVHFSA